MQSALHSGTKMRMADQVAVAKDPLAVEFGRRGGKAFMSKLTPEQRSEVARRAARGRWAKKHQQLDPPPTNPPDPNGPGRDEQWAEAGIMTTGRKPAIPVSVTSKHRSLRAAA